MRGQVGCPDRNAILAGKIDPGSNRSADVGAVLAGQRQVARILHGQVRSNLIT